MRRNKSLMLAIEEVRKRAAEIRLVVLDCDGVLTDGGLWYDQDGRVAKRFNVQDGLGIKAAQQAKLELAVISGLDHDGVTARVETLGIRYYYAGYHEKLPLVERICGELDITLSQVAFMGDDWVDAAVMAKVGLPMAVPDAQPEILDLAAWVSSRRGGHGAVREALAMILSAQGVYADLYARWT